jgi:hypothetical protein
MERRDSVLATAGGAVALVAVFLGVVVAAIIVLGVAAGAQEGAPGVATRTIDVVHRPADELVAPMIVDQLEPTTVLTIRAALFDKNATGNVRQCTTGEQRVCRNSIPVRFDGTGAANFQYLITKGSGCRLVDDRCTIEIRAGQTLSVIDTVFVDVAPPPGLITVTPQRGLLVGDTVTVAARNFPSGANLTLMICAAPSTSGPRCGSPGPVVAFSTDSEGAGSAVVRLTVPEVGADRVACGRQTLCTLVVSSESVGVRALPVSLLFDDAQGATYDTSRVAVGILAALAFALVAASLARSGDWTPPPEGGGRAIDDADYADLDIEADRFDENELRKVMPVHFACTQTS